jgi:hypothetical protein
VTAEDNRLVSAGSNPERVSSLESRVGVNTAMTMVLVSGDQYRSSRAGTPAILDSRGRQSVSAGPNPGRAMTSAGGDSTAGSNPEPRGGRQRWQRSLRPRDPRMSGKTAESVGTASTGSTPGLRAAEAVLRAAKTTADSNQQRRGHKRAPDPRASVALTAKKAMSTPTRQPSVEDGVQRWPIVHSAQ